MPSRYSQHITPFVQSELNLAQSARRLGCNTLEFRHLERAHILGQDSTYWHVLVHLEMLAWGVRNADLREIVGQAFRVVGAATKTMVGLIPQGNTGGARVSPFQPMPIAPDLAALTAVPLQVDPGCAAHARTYLPRHNALCPDTVVLCRVARHAPELRIPLVNLFGQRCIQRAKTNTTR